MSAGDLATILFLAVGFALSPAGIVELILALFAKRRVANSVAFVVALPVLTALALGIGSLGANAGGDASSGPNTATAVVLALFGTLLLRMGVKNWRSRRDTSEPPVFRAIGNMGPGRGRLPVAGCDLRQPEEPAAAAGCRSHGCRDRLAVGRGGRLPARRHAALHRGHAPRAARR